MNHLHLQEAAKHYAKLAEEAQKNLEQEQELNEDLLTIIEALCEELGIDAEDLLNLDEATMKKPSKSSKPKKVKKVVGERPKKVGERPEDTDWDAVNAYQRKLHASDGIRGLAPTPWS